MAHAEILGTGYLPLATVIHQAVGSVQLEVWHVSHADLVPVGCHGSLAFLDLVGGIQQDSRENVSGVFVCVDGLAGCVSANRWRLNRYRRS